MPGQQRNVAVLLAGGAGTRIGLALPMRLLTIVGKPIMEYSLDANPAVDDFPDDASRDAA